MGNAGLPLKADSVDDLLSRVGTVFRVFDRQDSGCVSYGVRAGGSRFFIKVAVEKGTVPILQNAARFYAKVRHHLVPELIQTVDLPESVALIHQWVEGEVLYSPEFRGQQGRSDPRSAHYRFCRLPVDRILDMLEALYRLHAYLESLGYVAVDFYDGCIIYDFKRHQVHFCDLDHYRPGPFVLADDRLPGSSRFMAPEEYSRGSLIDHRTNVYTMGAAAFVFLASGKRRRERWTGPPALWEVARKAVSPDRGSRQKSVNQFFEEWLSCR